MRVEELRTEEWRNEELRIEELGQSQGVGFVIGISTGLEVNTLYTSRQGGMNHPRQRLQVNEEKVMFSRWCYQFS